LVSPEVFVIVVSWVEGNFSLVSLVSINCQSVTEAYSIVSIYCVDVVAATMDCKLNQQYLEDKFFLKYKLHQDKASTSTIVCSGYFLFCECDSLQKGIKHSSELQVSQ